MNGRDFQREMQRARRDRVERMNSDPKHLRRLELVQKMQDNEGHLSEPDLNELKKLQRHFNLPDDL
jgi:hypothetical protein